MTDALVAGFFGKDLIDIAGLGGAEVSASYGGSGSGVLTLSDGTQGGERYLAAQLTGGSFLMSPDGHGGTQVALA
jgi:hypothetical protein